MENVGAHVGLLIVVPVLSVALLWVIRHVALEVIPALWADFKKWLGVDGRPYF